MATPSTPGTATGVKTILEYPQPHTTHPLDPLSADEILAISLSVRHYIASHTPVKAIKFITSYLLPPPKRAVLAFLGIPTSPGGQPEAKIEIVRKAEVDFVDLVNGDSYNAILSWTDGKWNMDILEKLPEHVHPQITVQELSGCEDIIRADERVQKLAAAIGVRPEQIYADGWSIGYDERFPQSRRIQQALLFARFSEHDNLYAHPLDFIPIMDSNQEKVIHIDFPSTYLQSSTNAFSRSVSATGPPALSADQLATSGRERIPPPLKPFNFLSDLRAKDGELPPRDDIKPLHIVQPDGVSFKVRGHEVEWQKWKMHISFTQREGIALSTITYNDDGEMRPIIYRLSLAEMVVPYGSPEHPHPRKFAFDVGEYGMGTQANELSLGCDCLGQIHYLPGAYVGHDGSAVVIKNAICIHEEDAGVLWKHTDYRPGGRSQSARSRRLVVSMVCTLANYVSLDHELMRICREEYIWNYHFYQDGSIELEIRLSGILQVYVSRPGEPTPFGTAVAEGIIAHNHQHLFSIRVDPMIDGLNNSVVETDVVPLPNAPTGSAENYAGNAFIAKDTVLQSEGSRAYDFEKDRRWRIVNPARKHYSSGKEVGFAVVMKGGATPLMARLDSWADKRAAFTSKALWVVRDKEDGQGSRMWPAGKYVPQTRVEPADSVGQWIKGQESVENEDIVLFLTIGTTHIPRPEDWPVMPVEHLRLTFKPQNFFSVNPSVDVPGTNDPHSRAAFPNGTHHA